jgi:putative multiple sugar transport system substrate-binding protein
MNDRDVFERRFGEAVRQYVEAAPTEIDAARLTHSLAAEVPRVRRLVALSRWRMPRLRFAWILVALGLLALIGLGVVASGGLRNVNPMPVPPTPQVLHSPPAVVASPAVATPRASAPASTDSPVQIGIVLPTGFRDLSLVPFQNALTGAGYSAEILFSQDVAMEKTQVEALIGRGMRVLILCPQDGSASAVAAEEAMAADVKVISFSRLIVGTAAVDYSLDADTFAVGAAQARYLIDKAGPTKGNNLYLYAGAASDNNAFVFLEGAWETLQPRIADGTFVIRNSGAAVDLQANATLTHAQQAAIIDQVSTNWDPGTARTVATSNLAVVPAADKGTVFILAPNDSTARAIADVFAADKDVTTSFVTGQDAEKASVQSIIDGRQGMTVFKDPRMLANDAIAAAVAFMKGDPPVATTARNNGTIDVPSRLLPVVAVTWDNIQATLIDTGYFGADEFTGSWPGKP